MAIVLLIYCDLSAPIPELKLQFISWTNIELSDTLDIDGQSFVPLLRGDDGHPREWIYSWYSRTGEVSKAHVFARTHRYKLYDSGEFYEIPNDYDELAPLNLEELDSEATEVYQDLSRVLENYKKRRLDKVQR